MTEQGKYELKDMEALRGWTYRAKCNGGGG